MWHPCPKIKLYNFFYKFYNYKLYNYCTFHNNLYSNEHDILSMKTRSL